MFKTRAYVICTSPRSGSTLLCRLLKASGVAGDPRSYFHEQSVAEWQADLDLTPDPAQSDLAALETVFSTVRERGTAGTGIFGLRLQRHSVEFFMKKLADLHPQFASDSERIEAAFGPTQFIHLTRPDKISQAVSFVKARQTGLWHQAPDGTELERLSEPQDPVYNRDDLRETHDLFLKYDQDWTDWFAKENITPYRITYDQLSAAPQETLKGVLKVLDADPRAAEGADPGIAKLADATSRDWVKRFKTDFELI
jgi:LPS sulfotransferase NodH